MRRMLPVFLGLGLLTALTACPGGVPKGPDTPDVPDRPGGGGGEVNPNGCGGYASTDIGAKIQSFLKATVALDKAISDAENHVKLACVDMGKAMKMSGGALEGDTKTVCSGVAKELEGNLEAGIKAEAELAIEYKPAVCTVDASAQASAQAECAGSGTAGTGGSSGSGACEGAAVVEASLEMTCTPAELDVSYGAEVVVDKAKLEMAVAAIKVGLPKLANVYARVKVLEKAAVTWSESAAALVEAGRSILSDVGDQVLCVSGQLAAAADMAAGMMGSVEVSVSVSVEVSGSAGASM